eukprot:765856-Hanusia_phi.AAC.7
MQALTPVAAPHLQQPPRPSSSPSPLREDESIVRWYRRFVHQPAGPQSNPNHTRTPRPVRPRPGRITRYAYIIPCYLEDGVYVAGCARFMHNITRELFVIYR